MYRTPERGMSTYPPSTPKGLANGTDASSEERGEPPRCILHQHHSDCEENHKKRSSPCLISCFQTKVNKIQFRIFSLRSF